MPDVVTQLVDMPIARLQAIYNHAWRQAHNDINKPTAETLMGLVEAAAFVQGYSLTGRGGSWEFKDPRKERTNGH